MITLSREVVEYRTATKLAAQYAESIVEIRQAIETLKRSINALNAAFTPSGSREFNISISSGYASQSRCVTNDEAADAIEKHLHLTAWRVLVEKLGIRKILSTKRAEQLDTLLEKGRVDGPNGVEELPEINEDTIIGVLMGLVDSAGDFLEESIREEFDHWKPRRAYSKYKTNQKHTFKLEKKLIREFAFDVWRFEGKSSLSGLKYHTAQRLTALDNIMHSLDGKGVPSGYSGPLVDAIRLASQAKEMTAKTDYFFAKWYNNGNLHLEFLRQDLLDRFNEICGRNRLAHAG